MSPAGYLVDEVGPDTADEGDIGLARMSTDRIVYGRMQDGHSAALGATTDAEALGNGTLLAITKRLRSLLGGLVVGDVVYPVLQAAITANTTGDTQVVAAVGGKSIRVVALVFSVDDAVSVGWKSAATTLVSPMKFSATGGMEVDRMPFGFFAQTAVAEALNVNLSANVGVYGSLNYITV